MDGAQWIGAYHDGFYIKTLEYGKNQLHCLNRAKNLPKDNFEYWDYRNNLWVLGSSMFSNSVYFPHAETYIYSKGNSHIYDTFAVVMGKNKTGLYTLPSAELICQYDFISEFSEGLALVVNDDAWGFIDTNGQLVTQLGPLNAGLFINGVSMVSLEGISGAIANPLIYTEWSRNEQERAAHLGLTVPQSDAPLTYDVMWQHITNMTERYLALQTKFAMENPARYDVDVLALRTALEADGYPATGVVDRQHLAVALAEVTRAYKNTSGNIAFDPVMSGSRNYIGPEATWCIESEALKRFTDSHKSETGY